MCDGDVCSREIINMFFIGQMSGHVENLNIGTDSGNMNVINGKLCLMVPLTGLDPSWTTSACASVHTAGPTRLIEHTKTMGSLAQCPVTFVFLHRSLLNFMCMETIQ